MLFIQFRVLRTLVAAARSAHPRESLLLLHGLKKDKDVALVSVSVPAGLEVYEDSAHFQPNMMPASSDYIGVFHSHPSGGALPSGADLYLASKEGGVQLLLAHPYEPEGLIAYDAHGRSIPYKIMR